MNQIQIIILAAGKGVRMNSELPKVLVSLKGKPLIVWLLENLKGYPDKQKIVVTGHKNDLVKQALGKSFTYAFQSEQLGTADAVLAAKPFITDESVIVLYGDMPFIKSNSLKKLAELHEQTQSNFSMFTTNIVDFFGSNQSYSNFGRIIRNTNKELVKITEVKYASDDEKKITEVNPGIYMFKTDWLWENIQKVKKNSQGEYYLTDLVEIAIEQKVKISTLNIASSEVYGINTPEQLVIAEEVLG